MIRKFKTFEEASRGLWNLSPDDTYYKRVSEFFYLGSRLAKLQIVKGIRKYKTIEEAGEK
jgi:hypothetical protein